VRALGRSPAALGIRRDYPPESVTHAADFFKASNLFIGTKKRVDGLTLRANDVEWTTRSGPEVSGPVLSLLMAMTGRKAALDDLASDGVAALASRM
jgi:hypothetical protein